MGIFQIGFVGMVSLVLASARTVAQKSLILCSIRAIPFCGITGSTPMVTRVDAEVNFDWEQGQIPVSQDQTTFSAKWNGTLVAHISCTFGGSPPVNLYPAIFAGIAEFERDLIRERTGAGREAAPKRGIRFGRPRKLSVDQEQLAQRLVLEGKSASDIARTFNVHVATIYRLAQVQ
jgi:Helix-turn-helix domain of resolvase